MLLLHFVWRLFQKDLSHLIENWSNVLFAFESDVSEIGIHIVMQLVT